ncbi:MAG TPA: nucleotide sugar dehydrogenase [bacterium]|mgnify:CR=1 FL=1|nr:nucleotide sugar dehydrogenase [bacterium]
MSLSLKLKNKTAKVGIIGLGYVGLPLAVEFAKAGFSVTGIDISPEVVNNVNAGKSYIIDVSSSELSSLVKKKKIRATADFSVIRELDTINICVPTPLRKSKDPDVSFIISAVTEIQKFIKKEQLIILESTTYPGTTEEIVKPLLEETGLKAGVDFYLAFSPERVDPGNKNFNTKNTPKVVGGSTPKCGELAKQFYSKAIQTVSGVSSTQTAELVKLLENTFRAVNIGLVNEMALMCDKLGINIWEVIDAASTKPFGFMPFYPGPGLGGHCIPIDPLYLSWKAKFYNFTARFIELADEVNSSMPDYTVAKIAEGLNDFKKCLNGSRILVLGITYKANISDVRESPAITVIEKLEKQKAKVFYNDPYVPEIQIHNKLYSSVKLTDKILNDFDAVVITASHSAYKWKSIFKKNIPVIDARNALKNEKNLNCSIYRL